MSGPVRLRVDPEFRRRTGVCLEDDARVSAAHDLPALRERVLARAAEGAPLGKAALGAKALVAGSALVAMVGAGAWVALRKEAPRRAATVPVTVAASVPETVTVPEVVPEVVPVTTPVAEPVPVPDHRTARKAAPEPTPATVPAAQPTAASTLADQLARYESGRSALRAGQLEKAAAAFGDYLALYPRGELWQEASLSLLEAQMRARRLDDAQTLATKLLAEPAFAYRRTELLRVKGEVLALAGRCDEADSLMEEARMSPSVITAALEDCRRRARDGR